MIAPVILALKKDRDLHIDVMGLTIARKVFEGIGIRCFSYRDLPISERAMAYGEAFIEKVSSRHPDIPEIETRAYMGLSFECLVEEHGAEKAAQLYEQIGRQAFLPVKLMETVIAEGGYDLVVATSSPRTEQAAIIAAGNLGIPSVCVVDLFAVQESAWIGKAGYARKVCVLADSVKEMLCSVGRSADEIVVTGNPAFDYLANSDLAAAGAEIRQVNGWSDEKVVLWCSQAEPKINRFTGKVGDPELPAQIEERLQKICADIPNLRLIARPHPGEDPQSRRYFDNIEYRFNDPLGPLLMAVDVVVVMCTTVGVEAALVGKPVIALNMSVGTPNMPLEKMGFAIGVDDLEDLKDTLLSTLHSSTTLSEPIHPVGTAIDSVCGTIRSLLDHD